MGWKKENGTWRYYWMEGRYYTDWHKIDGNWYFFDNNGYMQTGWFKAHDTYYYANDDGVMQTGWLTLNNKTYYLGTTGPRHDDNWYNIDGTYYEFNNKGVWTGKTRTADAVNMVNIEPFSNCSGKIVNQATPPDVCQKNTYQSICHISYEDNPMYGWHGGCTDQGGATGNGVWCEDHFQYCCQSAQNFCSINKGQTVADNLEIDQFAIQYDSNTKKADLDFINKPISAELWNRLYEIMWNIFNFPRPNKKLGVERRGTRNPPIYEKIVPTKTDTPDESHYEPWVDLGGYNGEWTWTVYKDHYPSFKEKYNYYNTDKCTREKYYVKLISGEMNASTDYEKGQDLEFKPYKYKDDDTWKENIQKGLVYLYDSRYKKGVQAGEDMILFDLYKDILNKLYTDNTHGDNPIVTEEIMREIQNLISNYEINKDRCRICNTACNGHCESVKWQSSATSGDGPGGCNGACMCYFQNQQMDYLQTGCYCYYNW